MRGINMKNRNEKDCNPEEHCTETGKQIKESIDTISQHKEWIFSDFLIVLRWF
jgi:hypothetical protein